MKVKRDLRSEKYFYKKSGAIPHFFYAKNLPIYCNLKGFFYVMILLKLLKIRVAAHMLTKKMQKECKFLKLFCAIILARKVM